MMVVLKRCACIHGSSYLRREPTCCQNVKDINERPFSREAISRESLMRQGSHHDDVKIIN
jgi:hypothetical protein